MIYLYEFLSLCHVIYLFQAFGPAQASDRLTWREARDECESFAEGGTLLSVHEYSSLYWLYSKFYTWVTLVILFRLKTKNEFYIHLFYLFAIVYTPDSFCEYLILYQCFPPFFICFRRMTIDRKTGYWIGLNDLDLEDGEK